MKTVEAGLIVLRYGAGIMLSSGTNLASDLLAIKNIVADLDQCVGGRVGYEKQ